MRILDEVRLRIGVCQNSPNLQRQSTSSVIYSQQDTGYQDIYGGNSISFSGAATIKRTKENDTVLYVIAFKELINEVVSSLSREINYKTREKFFPAPIIEQLRSKAFSYILVWSEQHYDYEMSRIFFDELDLPTLDMYLENVKDTPDILSKLSQIVLELKKL